MVNVPLVGSLALVIVKLVVAAIGADGEYAGPIGRRRRARRWTRSKGTNTLGSSGNFNPKNRNTDHLLWGKRRNLHGVEVDGAEVG